MPFPTRCLQQHLRKAFHDRHGTSQFVGGNADKLVYPVQSGHRVLPACATSRLLPSF
jgi:hypothetical protein